MRGHGEGTITKRSDGRWQAQISIEGGKRKTYYGKTKKEVQEKLRLAINEQKQGMLSTGPDQTLATYLNYWLDTVHKPLIRVRSYEQYLSSINHHIIPGLGKITLHKLTVQHIRAFYAGKLDEGLAPRTVIQMHMILHKALDDAMHDGLIQRNVVSLVKRPAAAKYEAQTLTVEQARKLLEFAKGHRIEGILILALTTGVRRGELLGLHWDDVDFEQKFMYIRRNLSRAKGRGAFEGETKSKTSSRRIMLSSVAVDALKEHKLRQESARLQAGEKWKERGLVFSGTSGQFLIPETVAKLFHRILSDLGFPYMRFHDLRHSAATILLTRGVHPKVVQEILGHSSISVTMDIYSHVLPSIHGDAADGMDDAFRHS